MSGEMARGILIDTHCHLDQYPDPDGMARSLDGTTLVVVAMTVSPSGFERLRHLTGRHVRVGVGVHPLHAASIPEVEWGVFARCLRATSYVGEVGLDFSPQGAGTRAAQEAAFRRVLRAVAGNNKVLSIHSRRAEAVVLDALDEFTVGPAIFHWYSGPLGVLDRIVAAGHYCSANPAMVISAHGRKVMERVPPQRMLTETDGPFIRVSGRPAHPGAVEIVYRHLANLWGLDMATTIDHVYRNFLTLCRR